MTGVTAKTSCCGVSTPASSREVQQLADHPPDRSAWCAIDRGPRAPASESSGSARSSVASAPMLVSGVWRSCVTRAGSRLDAGHAVELIGLAADLRVQERVLERRAGMLADEGQQGDLGEEDPCGPPTARTGSLESVADCHVRDGERATGPRRGARDGPRR